MAKTPFEEKVLARAVKLRDLRQSVRRLEREVQELEQALSRKRVELKGVREEQGKEAEGLVGELKL